MRLERERDKKKGTLTLKRPIDSLPSTGAESPQGSPPDPAGTGAQTQGLDHVGPALDAAVHPDLDLVKDVGAVLADLQQGVDGGRGGVEGAAAVVGEDDGGDGARVAVGVAGGEPCVLVR